MPILFLSLTHSTFSSFLFTVPSHVATTLTLTLFILLLFSYHPLTTLLNYPLYFSLRSAASNGGVHKLLIKCYIYISKLYIYICSGALILIKPFIIICQLCELMGLSSLHVCMDSSDHWLQGTIQDEGGIMESCSSPISGGEMLMTCSTRPSSSSMIGAERRLRPPHDQSLKCPRCESTHTKFCYYNNYSLSQPRYFCKTCRRYWTKGGTLRNIPVGGGCRKNKKVSSKKSSNNNNDPLLANTSSNSQQNHHLQLHHNAGPSDYINHHHHKDLQLSFPDVQFNSHLSNILGNNNNNNSSSNSHHSNFMESKYGIGPNFNGMLENPIIRPIDFIMESKLEGIIGNSARNFDFFGNGEMGMANVGLGGDHMNMNNHGTNFHGLHHHHHNASFGGMSLDGGSNNGVNFMMDSSSSSSCQRLMLPYDAATSEGHNNNNAPIDVKPNPKLLSLEWQQEQGCSDAGKDSFGYGSWSGMMNGYGSSATNPLV